MTFRKDDLIEVLRLRYDPYSAEAVFELARQKAELPQLTELDHGQLATLREALAVVGDRVQVPLARIDELLASAPNARSKSDAKAETKTESKPAAKADAKPETKPETKPDAKPSNNDGAPAVDTTIVLTGVPADEDDELIMCGGLAALGDWDPARGKPMARAGEAWQVTLPLAQDAEIPFKFVRRTAEGKLIWEPGDDRHLVAKPRVEVTWRSPAS
jgi:pyruvate/2-oxoglutarate dehydrogenase complex dihydrolipoamide acyltransferase (E2) component